MIRPWASAAGPRDSGSAVSCLSRIDTTPSGAAVTPHCSSSTRRRHSPQGTGLVSNAGARRPTHSRKMGRRRIATFRAPEMDLVLQTERLDGRAKQTRHGDRRSTRWRSSRWTARVLLRDPRCPVALERERLFGKNRASARHGQRSHAAEHCRCSRRGLSAAVAPERGLDRRFSLP